MHPADCPNGWDYEHHPNNQDILPVRSSQILIGLRNGSIDLVATAKDTRIIHQTLFNGLTPNKCEYFSGNYRGSDFPCLKFYNVKISSDPRVGVDSSVVDNVMNHLSAQIDNIFAAIDNANQLPNAQLPKVQKIMYLVAASCRLFVEFLRIHPYANGNGHMGRYIIFTFLGRYGYWPKKWPLDDRPPDPPYSEYIKRYRDGQPDLLEQFVLKCILGTI